jgi:glycosyltransferase involved in cell wall biosynthesis
MESVLSPVNAQPPIVSVVTPSYNSGEYIQCAMESVLRQNYPNVEYIIVDGGSTDETPAILERHRASTIQIIKPSSEAEASNIGFRRAQGEFIGWLGADDIYEPDAIQFAVSYFLQHPEIAMIYGDFRLVSPQGKLLKAVKAPEFDLRKLLRRGASYIITPSLFFRREVFQTIGYLDESLHYCCDYDYWIRIGQRLPVRHVPKILASYRLQQKSLTGRNLRSGALARESAAVRDRYLPRPSWSDTLAIRFHNSRRAAYYAKEYLKMLVGRSHRLQRS